MFVAGVGADNLDDAASIIIERWSDHVTVMVADAGNLYREALESAGLFQGSPEPLPELEGLKRLVGVKLPPLLPVQQRSTVEDWREK